MASSRGSGVWVIGAGLVGIVVGAAVGGLPARSQIRSLSAQVAELKDSSKCANRGVGRELAQAFAGKPWKAALDEDEVEALDRARAAPEPEPEEPEEDGVRFDFDLGEEGEGEEPENLEEGLAMAKDALALRQAQARAALDEQAAPTDQQWDQIDAAVADMNADLQALAGGFVDTLTAGEEPSRREAMIFAADTLDVLLEADERIWGSLTDEQRAQVGDEVTDPMAHIDPELLDAFMELDR